MLSALKTIFATLLLLFCLPLNSHASDALKIVTTTAHLADLVENIKSDAIDVEVLIGTGIDPHLYRPTRSDIIKLRRADLILYNGLHLEGKMVELLEKLSAEKTVISIAKALDNKTLLLDEESAFDPHIWMDVSNWIKATKHVTHVLSKIDPAHSDVFQNRADLYIEKLAALDTHIKTSIASIPREKRKLITAHDAFGYFGKAYGVGVLGIQGLSTESETSLRRMDDLAAMIAIQKIPSIFTETSVSDRNIQALAENIENRGHSIRLGKSLYSDSLGPKGSSESTYIGMMLYNTSAITDGLGGAAQPFYF